jgi:hypothetical protein
LVRVALVELLLAVAVAPALHQFLHLFRLSAVAVVQPIHIQLAVVDQVAAPTASTVPIQLAVLEQVMKVLPVETQVHNHRLLEAVEVVVPDLPV